MDGRPLGFRREGDWLIGHRYRIARMDLWIGRRYCAWNFDWDRTDTPFLIGCRDDLDSALALLPMEESHGT